MDEQPQEAACDLQSQLRAQFQESNRGLYQRVDVDVCGNELRIRGSVSSYYAKQMASELCRRAGGDFQIRNELRVEYPDEGYDD